MSDSENKTPAKRKAPPHAWKPGESGNPGGRPKGLAEFREWLAEEDPKNRIARRLALRNRMYQLAFDDDLKVAVKAAELLLAYDMGRPPQRLEDENGNGVGVNILVLPAESGE